MLCRRVLHLYIKYSEKVIVYAVIVHQTNISYSNEVPVCKACIIMVGRTASVISLFYSLLPEINTIKTEVDCFHQCENTKVMT